MNKILYIKMGNSSSKKQNLAENYKWRKIIVDPELLKQILNKGIDKCIYKIITKTKTGTVIFVMFQKKILNCYLQIIM